MGSIINGRNWTRERIAFLEAALSDESPEEFDDEQRLLVRAELEQLRDEHAAAGRRRRRWWLLGRMHPPPGS